MYPHPPDCLKTIGKKPKKILISKSLKWIQLYSLFIILNERGAFV